MKKISNLSGTATTTTTPPMPVTAPVAKQPGDLYRQFYADGVLLTDRNSLSVFFPWTELQKAALSANAVDETPKTT